MDFNFAVKNRSEEERIQLLQSTLVMSGISPKNFPFDWLVSTDYFRAPASKKFHAAYPGGLYEHSLNVTYKLLQFTEAGLCSPWGRPESPIIVGMLHDATKIGRYAEFKGVNQDTGEMEIFYKDNPDYVNLGGHGNDSVLKLKQVMRLTEEEELCIRYHMGAYETDDWDDFDKAIRKFPNVLFTHTADMYASKCMEVTP